MDQLTDVGGYEGSEWKVTLKDSSRSIATSTDSLVIGQGQSGKISYNNVTTGANNYVSALIANGSGEVCYYGRLADTSIGGSGTAILTIPTDMKVGNYTVKLFSEQYNGPQKPTPSPSPSIRARGMRPLPQGGNGDLQLCDADNDQRRGICLCDG